MRGHIIKYAVLFVDTESSHMHILIIKTKKSFPRGRLPIIWIYDNLNRLKVSITHAVVYAKVCGTIY